MTAVVTLHSEWMTNLRDLGVKLPGEGTFGRNTLEYLYTHINTWVAKESIISAINYKGNDLQAPRHLGASGWNIEQDFKGNYKLVTVAAVADSWIPNKRTTNISPIDFKSLKIKFNNECASCGSKEGTPHRHTNKITKLERGHKDPELDLTLDNMIPQCNYCNKRYKDRFKFDNYGMIVAVRTDDNTGWRKP
jgi:hypothetical protein